MKLFDKAIASGGAISYNGPDEEAYCREFADFHGGGYADGVNSGTSAVYVALRTLEIEPFTEAFVARANQLLTAKDLEPTLRLDAEISLGHVTESLVRDLDRLAPFGEGNPKPRFASPLLALDGEPRTVGKTGAHLSFRLTDGQIRLRAIAFGQSHQLPTLLEHRRCRVAFQPILNTFNNRTSVELQILDFAFPDR